MSGLTARTARESGAGCHLRSRWRLCKFMQSCSSPVRVASLKIDEERGLLLGCPFPKDYLTGGMVRKINGKGEEEMAAASFWYMNNDVQ